MTTAVHNVDQRSPVVSIEHAALPCVVECEQYGPGHAKFVADTSSVIWACGKLLPQHLWYWRRVKPPDGQPSVLPHTTETLPLRLRFI